ncbi:hypothetical protein CDAR_382151 [Caerostris darwini]|uniref:Uncharacterized protein n=1 Tax=Caerostris darwini TaxID=1538125 RepID=A0AAV4WPL7_9ARAC|nr:hypothetical protein CDAR_382151 [Caerostris darwini]
MQRKTSLSSTGGSIYSPKLAGTCARIHSTSLLYACLFRAETEIERTPCQPNQRTAAIGGSSSNNGPPECVVPPSILSGFHCCHRRIVMRVCLQKLKVDARAGHSTLLNVYHCYSGSLSSSNCSRGLQCDKRLDNAKPPFRSSGDSSSVLIGLKNKGVFCGARSIVFARLSACLIF